MRTVSVGTMTLRAKLMALALVMTSRHIASPDRSRPQMISILGRDEKDLAVPVGALKQLGIPYGPARKGRGGKVKKW